MAVPRYLTSFVGRDRDLRSLERLLSESRLVTLVGPGGAGKTRLAAELIGREAARWPDGVWWVDLADVDGDDRVAGAIVAILQLPGRGHAVDVLAAWLEAKSALLVLDNCEHLVAGAAAVSKRLLERAPRLAILATSREPLGVGGEARWQVAQLSSADASRLFESRARLVAPDFSVDDANSKTVGKICARLDELPLAIELAASRTGMMTEREILDRLQNSLAVLSGGDRSAPARQRTMAAAIDWSYRLLSVDEQRLFRRLAVFHGGFDLEAAESVCGEGLGGDVLDLLAGLVQKSLVVYSRLEDGAGRYRLLDLQATFAAARLGETDETSELRRRHYEYFKARIATMPNVWFSTDVPRDTLADLAWKRRELPNLWAAIRWARHETEDLGLSLALDTIAADFGQSNQAREFLDDLIASSNRRDKDMATALCMSSWLAANAGDYSSARRLAQRGYDLASEVGDVMSASMSLNVIGMSFQDSRDFDAAAETFARAEAMLDPAQHPRAYFAMKNSAGVIAYLRGEDEKAIGILERCEAHDRESGDIWSLGATLDSLAWPLVRIGDVEGAAARWREALTIGRDLDDHWVMLYGFVGLALSASALGDHRRAIYLFACADRMAKEWSFAHDRWTEPERTAALERSRGQMSEGDFERFWVEGAQASEDEAIAVALEGVKPSTLESGPLSRRETEVARLVASGSTNREIAARLFISERTAEGHVERIRSKLRVRSRAEVAAWAVAHGLVETEKEKGALAGTPSSRTRKPHRS